MPRLNARLCRLGYKLLHLDLNCLLHERLWRSGTAFYFIQVGAFDGQTFDPLARYVKRYRLSGALIEPQQRPFSELKAHYRDNPQLSLYNAALAENVGYKTFYRVSDEKGVLPAWSQQLGSFKRENIIKHDNEIAAYGIAAVPEIASYVIEEQVPCITFDLVLDESGMDHVDLVQIDVEGFDFEVITLFPFYRMTPAIIRYEHMHMSDDTRRSCFEFLKQKGYRFVTEFADTVAYLPKECGC